MKWLKSTTALVSILAFILNSTAVFADELNKSEEQIVQEQNEIIQQARELEKNFDDPSRPEVELDHFQLLSQTFNNTEKEDLLAKIDEIQKADPDGENVEDFVDTDVPLKKYYFNNLSIQVVDEKGNELKSLAQKDFAESFSPKFNEDLKLQNGSRFKIVDAKGNVLHTFHREVGSVGFFGPYLVYLERGSYNANTGSVPLRFINLDYFKAAIGNANLPVFTIPVKSVNAYNLEIEKGKLLVNGTKLSGDAIKVLSDVYQVFFNISVSLVDPRTQVRAEGMLKELALYFNKTLELQDETVKGQLEFALDNDSGLQKIAGNLEKKGSLTSEAAKLKLQDKEELAKAIKSGDRERILNLIQTDSAFKNNILQTNRSIQASRLFLSKMYMTIAKMADPQPLGSTKILKALIMFVEGTLKRDRELTKYAKTSLVSHPYFKYIKFGSFAVSAAAIGSVLPEPYTFHLYQLVDLSSMLFEQAHGYLNHINFGANFGDLYSKASQVAFSGLPHAVDYFKDEVISKFFVGLTSTITIPFMVFGVPHFLVNGIRATKDVAKNWKEIRLRGLGRLETFKVAFIKYVQDEQDAYEKIMSESEKELSRVDRSNLTEEEVADLREIIKSKTQGKASSKLESLKMTLGKIRSGSASFLKNTASQIGFDTVVIGKGAIAMYRVGEFIEGTFSAEKTQSKRIDTFGKAFLNFCISYPSLTHTFKRLATIWNYVFITRSFALRPSTWYMVVVYPEFFGKAMRSVQGNLHNPSVWNGGKLTTATLLSGAFNRGAEHARERLLLNEWEKAVIPLEKIVYEEAMNKALEALVKRIDDPKKLEELFDSTQMPGNRETRASLLEAGRPTGGISGLTDAKLKKLSGDDLSFFRAYFTKTYDDTMRTMVEDFSLNSLTPEAKDQITKIENMSDLELKKFSSAQTTSATEMQAALSDPAKAKHVREQVKQAMAKAIVENKVGDFANNVSSKFKFFFERRKINYHHNLLQIVDPKSPQVGRFATAERMLAKPTAVARAVRAEVAGLLVDKPLSLITILALYAGVTEGIMKPFHPEAMFGPDSFFYMSRYLILNGFVVGTVISIMADTWMKVQTDSRIQDEGGFDKVPTKEWRQKGFWRYYLKSLFNPNNKWSTNQIFYSKLIWSNIPAVFVMTLVTNFLTLGRFDLTAFLCGYIFIYATPFMGINLKIDQAFELASGWVRAQIPKKYRAHPEAQEYIQREIQKKKLMFNFVNHVYQTVVGTMNALFENMDTAEHGTRSFARLIFFGYTPTELATIGLRKVGDTLGFIPGVEPFTHFCEHLLTNNDTSLTKIKPE